MSRDAWEWADQFKPAQPGPDKSWGMYYTMGVGASLVDAGFAIADKFRKTSPPLYIPEEDAPLYNLAQATIAKLNLPDPETFAGMFIRQCPERIKFASYPSVFIKLVDMAEDVLIISQPYLPAMMPAELSKGIEGARWRDKVKAITLFTQQFDIAELLTTCHEVACQFLAALPEIARIEWSEFDKLIQTDDQPTGLRVELNDLMENLPELIEYMIYPFYKAAHMQSGLYSQIRDALDRNACAASGLAFTDENRWSERLVLPTKYKGGDVIETYLRDSPLIQVFQ